VNALVHLDAGDDALARKILGEGFVARHRALPQRLVEEDYPADELLDALGGEQQVAIGAAVGFVAFDAYRLEALFTGAARLVRCEQPFSLGNHGCGGLG